MLLAPPDAARRAAALLLGSRRAGQSRLFGASGTPLCAPPREAGPGASATGLPPRRPRASSRAEYRRQHAAPATDPVSAGYDEASRAAAEAAREMLRDGKSEGPAQRKAREHMTKLSEEEQRSLLDEMRLTMQVEINKRVAELMPSHTMRTQWVSDTEKAMSRHLMKIIQAKEQLDKAGPGWRRNLNLLYLPVYIFLQRCVLAAYRHIGMSYFFQAFYIHALGLFLCGYFLFMIWYFWQARRGPGGVLGMRMHDLMMTGRYYGMEHHARSLHFNDVTLGRLHDSDLQDHGIASQQRRMVQSALGNLDQRVAPWDDHEMHWQHALWEHQYEGTELQRNLEPMGGRELPRFSSFYRGAADGR
eukprot:TRINITY_DN47644_c0_g1_i1.p1 TRINITY_DN47644_c0_g1~~TRINITY_DN47644_c0_g1_i1.p1  ORF type:complete len:385 (+),score=114.96 TRINITY_DN47644_c0_g1_i1:76-1155(+)